MAAPDRPTNWLRRLWNFGCSLKLAITLASLTTLLVMGGSLVMPRHPELFASLDHLTMRDWLPGAWRRAPGLTFWVPAAGLCLLLFGLNTLCCLLDWLLRIRSRWRKTGEYLVHAGFCLLVIAYAWGNLAGARTGTHQLFPGDRQAIPGLPGYELQLDAFTPQFSPEGRPLDMLSDVTLFHQGAVVRQQQVRINHPLIHDGLIVLTSSMGQALSGFRCYLPQLGMLDLTEGSRLPLPGGGSLTVRRLLADARRSGRGQVMAGGDQLGNPAMLLNLQQADGSVWEGWYFLRGPLPAELAASGVSLRPTEPLFNYYSLLTINRDPGDRMALAGGLCLLLGVLFAFVSFYYKRSRGDRPIV